MDERSFSARVRLQYKWKSGASARRNRAAQVEERRFSAALPCRISGALAPEQSYIPGTMAAFTHVFQSASMTKSGRYIGR